MRASSVTFYTTLFLACAIVAPFGLGPSFRNGISGPNKGGLFSEDPCSEGPRHLDRRGFVEALVAAGAVAYPSPAVAYADPKTGVLLPEEGEIQSAVPAVWDDESPFESMPRDKFSRLDTNPDSEFYTDPRFVEHIDENAVKSMTSYISKLLQNGDSVLDLCSSWTSHIDAATQSTLQLKRVSGLGMNEKELSANKALTDWTVLDLNKDRNPKLPYSDSTFDVVLCQLSIDYLTHPLEVMNEVGRVLAPGGKVVILFSNRLFIQKAVGLWTGADDLDHAYIVASYLHYSNGGFDQISAEDLSTRTGRGKARRIIGDPLYAVTATKRDASN